ncbi:MAG: response regulator [Bacteroidetes bacterium]|nr:response regulator [Bacteroidota bacterium]
MKERVLIFVDDNDILEVCTIVLESNGFEVLTHKNCEEILDKVSAFMPDVILMDNRIPPLGGIRASQEIRTSIAFKDLPIVFFSANRDVAGLAKEAGADYFIEKPFDLDDLVDLINKACDDGAPGEGEIGF